MLKNLRTLNRRKETGLKKKLNARARLAVKFKHKKPVEESCSLVMRWHQQSQVQQCASSVHTFSMRTGYNVSYGGWAQKNCTNTEGNMLHYKCDSCKGH
jgi:hypothetical protein